MRVFGIILIIAGVLMFVFNGIDYQTEKRVVDIGPLKVDKQEDKHIGWPVYAGVITVLAGVVVIAAGKRKV